MSYAALGKVYEQQHRSVPEKIRNVNSSGIHNIVSYSLQLAWYILREIMGLLRSVNICRKPSGRKKV